MAQRATVTLPCGLWINGIREQTAVVRPLTGADELLLSEEASSLPPVRQATLLLSRCVQRFGPLAPVDEKAMRDLPLGDREALLLHIRRLTFGNRISLRVPCPSPDCGKTLAVELSVDDLLKPTYHDARPLYEATIDGEKQNYVVLFRLPNGGDQEAAVEAGSEANATTAVEAAVEAANEATAQAAIESADGGGELRPDEVIVQRAVYEVRFPNGELADDIPSAVVDRLPAIMTKLDPQAGLVVRLPCKQCGRDCVTAFDTTRFLLDELVLDAMQVFRDVHVLALHYHWSERAILSLTAPRRRRYLKFITESDGNGGQSGRGRG